MISLRCVVLAYPALCASFLISLSGHQAAASGVTSLRLVSITGIVLDGQELVAGLNLGITNLQLVKICHKPPGWTMNVTGGTQPAIDGGASTPRSAIGPRDLGQLRGLFLMRRVAGTIPHLSGVIDVEVPGDPPTLTRQPLDASNFRMKPALHCAPFHAARRPSE